MNDAQDSTDFDNLLGLIVVLFVRSAHSNLIPTARIRASSASFFLPLPRQAVGDQLQQTTSTRRAAACCPSCPSPRSPRPRRVRARTAMAGGTRPPSPPVTTPTERDERGVRLRLVTSHPRLSGALSDRWGSYAAFLRLLLGSSPPPSGRCKRAARPAGDLLPPLVPPPGRIDPALVMSQKRT
ncbi:hypothetical protein BU14_0289s0009 [Porphyra umbilicalis]|uniref:Uncharacterized protein n=1 Tax=Porphyra umbilicalis TaxID=2786 RepID=A0A1X6P0Z2_PORUM|nr:hypothetical protein BU14_0289s0009 [Porphyra umbilicalis]|eukprot:OSX74430.1 hypothetical protein BU14_0289s0009 [Porphyra umbilicalis]